MASRNLYTLGALVALLAVSCDKQGMQAPDARTEGQDSAPAANAHRIVSFNDEVMPILSDKCFHCHGPDAQNQESDFRLDTEEHAKQALKDGGYGIVAGNLEKSILQ